MTIASSTESANRGKAAFHELVGKAFDYVRVPGDTPDVVVGIVSGMRSHSGYVIDLTTSVPNHDCATTDEPAVERRMRHVDEMLQEAADIKVWT